MEKIARKIVEEILDDMSDRSGADWFVQCDDEVQEEIVNKWVSIIARNLESLGAATEAKQGSEGSHNSESVPCKHNEAFYNKAGFVECRSCGTVFRN